MVHYQRLKSGPRNIASQRVRRASLCSPFLLPSISAVCPWGIPQETLHGGLPLTGSITVLWVPRPILTETPSSLPPRSLWVLSQTLNSGMGREESFSSKQQRRQAGWLYSLSLGLPPAPWLIPTLGRRARLRSAWGWEEGGSFPWQPPLFTTVLLSAKTVFPGTSLGVVKEEQLDHLISFFPEQGPSHLCLLSCEWRRRPKNGAPAGTAPETETAPDSALVLLTGSILPHQVDTCQHLPPPLPGKTASRGPRATPLTDKENALLLKDHLFGIFCFF